MKIFGWTFGKAQKSYDPYNQNFSLTNVTGYGNTKVSDKELYAGWVSACVRLIADQVAQIELVLHKQKNGIDEVVNDHPALKLLEYVNPFFTKYTLFERLQANLELHGNEYWLLEKDGKGTPIEIIPLNPQCMRVVRPDKPTRNTYVEYYEYDVLGEKKRLMPDEIIHFKTFNPFSDVLGMSTIETARLSVETDFFTKEYNRRFFQNDAVPNAALTHPDSLSVEAQNRILDKWNDKYSGFRKSHKIALLHGGMDIKLLGTHNDMQFIEQSRMSRDDILALFGVPKTALGITDDVTVSNAQATNYILSLRTVKPRMHRIVDTLNEFFLPHFKDSSLSFDFISPVQEDKTELVTTNATRFNNGQLTINEWRQEDGLPPIDGGDVVFLPFGLSAYGSPIEEKKVIPATQKSFTERMKEDITRALKKRNVKNQTSTMPVNDATVFENNSQRNRTGMDSEKFEVLGKKLSDQQRKREEPYIKRMKEIILGIFEKQRKEIIKNIPTLLKSKGKKAIVPYPIDEDKWINTTINLITPLMGELFTSEGKNAYQNLGLDPDDFTISTPTAQEFLRKNAKKFAGEITQTTTNIVRNEIADYLDQGFTIAEMVSALTEEFEGFDFAPFTKDRAEMIALTETHRTASESELQSWKESGLVVKKIWYTALDERVCPECDSLHGTEVDIDEPFVDQEGLREMGFKNYDGDIAITQLHPRCRCTAIPVLE